MQGTTQSLRLKQDTWLGLESELSESNFRIDFSFHARFSENIYFHDPIPTNPFRTASTDAYPLLSMSVVENPCLDFQHFPPRLQNLPPSNSTPLLCVAHYHAALKSPAFPPSNSHWLKGSLPIKLRAQRGLTFQLYYINGRCCIEEVGSILGRNLSLHQTRASEIHFPL